MWAWEVSLSHIFVELDKILLVSGIRWRQQVADEENHEHELNRRPNWVILVAGLHISNNDCGARHLLEGGRCDGRGCG